MIDLQQTPQCILQGPVAGTHNSHPRGHPESQGGIQDLVNLPEACVSVGGWTVLAFGVLILLFRIAHGVDHKAETMCLRLSARGDAQRWQQAAFQRQTVHAQRPAGHLLQALFGPPFKLRIPHETRLAASAGLRAPVQRALGPVLHFRGVDSIDRIADLRCRQGRNHVQLQCHLRCAECSRPKRVTVVCVVAVWPFVHGRADIPGRRGAQHPAHSCLGIGIHEYKTQIQPFRFQSRSQARRAGAADEQIEGRIGISLRSAPAHCTQVLELLDEHLCPHDLVADADVGKTIAQVELPRRDLQRKQGQHIQRVVRCGTRDYRAHHRSSRMSASSCGSAENRTGWSSTSITPPRPDPGPPRSSGPCGPSPSPPRPPPSEPP
ncbi:hypothetical protein D3C71_1204640 [compost metagenome]